MPFKSEKQRRYMHANLPKIAQQWEKKYKKGGRVKVNKGGYIGKAIRSEYGGVKLSNPSYEKYYKGMIQWIPQLSLLSYKKLSETTFKELATP